MTDLTRTIKERDSVHSIPLNSHAGDKDAVVGADNPDLNHLDLHLSITGHDAHSTVGSDLGRGQGLRSRNRSCVEPRKGLAVVKQKQERTSDSEEPS